MKLLSTFFLLLISITTFASDCDDRILFLDETQRQMNLFFDPNYYSKRVLAQETFCKVTSKLARLFPDQNGIKIKYEAIWDLPDPNARADYSNRDGQYVIEIYGGLLNLPRFSEGALAAITCHELGHIKGGTKESRKKWDGRLQPLNTAEGFADYFASHICLKKYYEDQTFTEEPRIKRILSVCQQDQKRELCINVLNASYDNLNSTSTEAIDLNIPSSNIASQTSYAPQNHPKHDCRFDILVAGYLCHQIEQDVPCGFNLRGRYTGNSDKRSLPPRCFFKP